MDLLRGDRLGTVETKEIGGFRLSLIHCDRDVTLPWHRHGEPALTFVIAGRFSERLRNGHDHYSPRVS